MKLKNVVLLSIFILIISKQSNAQKIELLSGDLKVLKGQKSFALKFTYDNMIISADYTEKQYLEKKKKEWDLKDPNRGDAFVTQWYVDREGMYEPSFIKHFENYSKMQARDKNSKYTLILKTTRTEGGWDGGVIAHPGQIDGELWIVESENDANVIAKIGFYDFSGKIKDGGDFEMTTRIQSSYETAGKILGSYLSRKLK